MNYKRLGKPIARKLYNQGCDVLLLPCKVKDSAVKGTSPWVKPVTINIKNCQHDANKFDRTVHEYVYYNCNSEMGYYPHYFVSEDDYNNFITGGKSDGIKEDNQETSNQ